MDRPAPSMFKPALIGGGVFGALAAIPGFDVLNTCTCCSLVIAGGFLSAYLYSKECRAAGSHFSPGTGALVGLIAGAFFALATTIVGTMVVMTFGKPAIAWLLESLQTMPNVPPEAQDQLDEARRQLDDQAFSILSAVWMFFTSVLLGAIFSTIGGLIGGAVFKVQPVPPAAPTRDMMPPSDRY